MHLDSAARGGAGEATRPSRQPGGATGSPPGDPETVARAICLRLLAASARTRAELADRLRRRGVPDAVAGTVLDRFVEVGLVDDAALASTYAETQCRERGLAGPAVAARLRQRGVADQTIRDALAAIGPDAEEAAARRLVRHRLPGMAGLSEDVRARRLLGLLARRGYPAELANRVVREEAGEFRGADDGCEIEFVESL
ncbi:MAG: recombination regulator RecX [Actinomycetia bacterium]|nr:recombination regulator RecX [Actinomycetes bacterium]